MKKKKKVKKEIGKQVKRPSFKKPRPQKYVDAKLPTFENIIEPINPPEEIVEVIPPILQIEERSLWIRLKEWWNR